MRPAIPSTATRDADALVVASGIAKRFGAVQALRRTSITVGRGQCLGVAGHNGAGKSTLMNVLCGTLAPDEGTLQIGGRAVTGPGLRWDVREARHLGVHRVFQELSLCPNLTLAENMHVARPIGAGRGWRGRAGAALVATLDAVFPGHGLRPDQVVAELSIGRRQMVEIARAFTSALGGGAALMILDEPTSSLDGRSAAQLLAYLRRFVAEGNGCILITHKLGEIFEVTDRVLVMRDGEVVGDTRTADSGRDALVRLMGQDETPGAVATTTAAGAVTAGHRAQGTAGPEVLADIRPRGGAGTIGLKARRGEVVGLAGLAGHGQTDLLVAMHRAAGRRAKPGFEVCADVAFVAGDRPTDGVFPLWSIERNMSIGWLAGLRRNGLIAAGAERAKVRDWRERLGLQTPDETLSILSLSGGNQQKALFARALGSSARLVLMDDPMRGVDVGTKHDVYQLIAAEARGGRSFVWYTTEFDELHHCDRIYVFNDGRIRGELARAELSQERVLQLSFAEAAA